MTTTAAHTERQFLSSLLEGRLLPSHLQGDAALPGMGAPGINQVPDERHCPELLWMNWEHQLLTMGSL